VFGGVLARSSRRGASLRSDDVIPPCRWSRRLGVR
jgi:hypothetical protein